MPTGPLQASGVEDSVALRLAGHPAQGTVPRWRFDPTPTGFVLEVEEAWNSGGEHWTCRELFRADIGGEGITQLSVYCTGDWDAARRAEHAAAYGTRSPRPDVPVLQTYQPPRSPATTADLASCAWASCAWASCPSPVSRFGQLPPDTHGTWPSPSSFARALPIEHERAFATKIRSPSSACRLPAAWDRFRAFCHEHAG